MTQLSNPALMVLGCLVALPLSTLSGGGLQCMLTMMADDIIKLWLTQQLNIKHHGL